MVLHQVANLMTGVRFPLPAQILKNRPEGAVFGSNFNP